MTLAEMAALLYAVHMNPDDGLPPELEAVPAAIEANLDAFCAAPDAWQSAVLDALNPQMGRLSPALARRLTRAVAAVFRCHCQGSGLPLDRMMPFYEFCRLGFHLYNSGTYTPEFDEAVVRPFARYLDQSVDRAPRRRRSPPDEPLHVCYILHNASFAPGRPVAPVIAGILRAHLSATRGRHKFWLYVLMEPSQEIVDLCAELGVAYRAAPPGLSWWQMTQAVDAALAQDSIDVVFTCQHTALATYLYQKRCAALQIWIVVADPFWSISQLDWTFTGMPPDPSRGLRTTQMAFTYPNHHDRVVPPEEISRARQLFPGDAKILGVFTRLVKITKDYLDCVEGVLVEVPNAYFIITGVGDPTLINDFIAGSPIGHKIKLINENVDIPVYGRTIDVMPDTFPFEQGLSSFEAINFGKPVVSIYKPDLFAHRDPELVVADSAEFVAMIVRLLTDSDFYRRKEKVAYDLADAVRNGPNILGQQIGTEIDRLWRDEVEQ